MKKIFGLVFGVMILLCSCENPMFSDAAGLYKVTFSVNGGSSIDEIYTNEISDVPYSQKANCELQGWYLSSDFSGEAVKFPFKVKEKTTLYAKWLQRHAVVFNANGGSEVPQQLASIIEAAPLSFKENYSLEGWYENADFSGGKIQFPYVVTRPVILHAKWARTYNASFDAKGGTEVSSFAAATISDAPRTSKEGFSFAGWYLSSDFSGTAVIFPYALTSDTAFYAKWLELFTVTFETNGGSALGSMQTGYIEAEPKATKADASFGGWYLDSELSQKIEFPYEVTSNVTLYAKWVPIQYTISYDPNGATSGTAPASETVTKGSSYVVKGNSGNLSKAAGTFIKWNTKANGTGTSYTAGMKFNVTSDITLYAQWGKDCAQMIDVKGGTFTMGDGSSNINISPYVYNYKHQVTLSSFRIAAYELTWELWSEVYAWAQDNGYTLANASYVKETAYDTYIDNTPASYISWNMAVVWLNAYSEMKGLEPVYYYNDKILKDYSALSYSTSITFDSTKNGYRLPTEAEWEFAAGSGNYEYRDDLTYATTNTNSKVDDFAWYSDNAGTKTHAVGTKSPNRLGIYDMSGNVAEWCWDYYGSYPSAAQTNPKGASSGTYRICRGGAYNMRASYNQDGESCSIRYRYNRYIKGSYYYQSSTNNYCGLRVAQNAQ